MNRLCYGDCLDVLRAQFKDESVDLVYLDPPSNRIATGNMQLGRSTIEKLRGHGRRLEHPGFARGGLAFKRAEEEAPAAEQKTLF
jgi:hypothetical protein